MPGCDIDDAVSDGPGRLRATMSAEQVAVHLHVTTATVLRLVDDGVLRSERTASAQLRLVAHDVERFGSERSALQEELADVAAQARSTGLFARSPTLRGRCRAVLRVFHPQVGQGRRS